MDIGMEWAVKTSRGATSPAVASATLRVIGPRNPASAQ